MHVNDPFVIDVPEGCTRLDLKPILMPLALSLMRKALGHRVCEDDVLAALSDTCADAPLIERMVRLRGLWVRDYLDGRGWYIHNDFAHFQASIRTPSGQFNQRSATVVLYHGYKEPDNGASGYWKAFKAIAEWQRRSIEEVLADVEASVSAVDRLATLVR